MPLSTAAFTTSPITAVPLAMKQPPVRFLEETDGNGKQCEAVSPAAAIDDCRGERRILDDLRVALHQWGK